MPNRTDLVEGLSPARIKAACAAIGMSDASSQILAETAAAIAASEDLRRIAVHCAGLIFELGMPADEAIRASPAAACGTELPPFFDPVVLLAGFRRLAANHRHRGIPRDITVATLRDLDLWVEHHRTTTGAWAVRETEWIGRHLTGRLFQLGRLQFEPRAFELPFAVFRSRSGTDARVLVEGGRVCREDGQFVDADHRSLTAGHDSPGTWRSRFVEDGRGWQGSMVDTSGRLQPGTEFLDREHWTLVARRGDPVLAVHIPAGGRFNGPLTREACADSFRRAIPFFARHRIAAPPRLLTCISWMLDPQLARGLPPNSHLVSFQKFFRLLPAPAADDRQTLERVFGGPVADWSRAPRDTSLRRIITEGVEAGVHWRTGAGVMLPWDAAGR